MEVLNLLLFVGGFWVLGAVSFFAWTLITGSDQHSDRLALLPLDDNWNDPQLNKNLTTEEFADDGDSIR